MPVNLTPNAIPAIVAGDMNAKPLVQVLDIKLIPNSKQQERYRIWLSDAISSQQAMLATQLNEQIRTGRVKKGSIVQLIEYICSPIQNRKIIVVLNMETIRPDCAIIGDPKSFVESDLPIREALPYNTNKANNYHLSAQNATFNVQNFKPTVQPPVYKSHGAIVRNEAPACVLPIAALNPYQGQWAIKARVTALNPYQGQWAIKARVTAKGDMRHYNNARGDGKVFSFDLLDSNGGEIRMTCFNAVVDRFYDAIEVGKVYLISKGVLKPAQKNFNHLKNEWEVLLELTSTVELCSDEDGSIPKQHFSFRPIRDIENVESNCILDVIGVVTSVNPSVPILRKNGRETQKRTLNLKDYSGRSVELTLWGEFCNREGKELQDVVHAGIFPILAVKAGKVNDFSGKSIGTISASQLFINPDFSEARSLRDWYDRVGKDSHFMSISKDTTPREPKNDVIKTVSQIKHEGLGRSVKPDWITVRAEISFIKTDTFCYTACPLMIGDRQCNKKVTISGNTGWKCDRCNQEFEECDYRYLLQVQIQDHTGITWVTAFQESGEDIFGYSAKELYLLKYEQQDEEKFSAIIKSKLFNQFAFRLKVKEELYGDEQRVKITVVKAGKVDYSSESRYVLNLISRFCGQ